VVLIAQRLERGPVYSRVGAFPSVLSVARRVEVNQGLNLVWCLKSLVMTGA